ncbi:MAG: hypothetical protein NC344_09830 [Bacteroidales bacterium]|nr:hypothetical protein [Bacteroidales bacterium]MCM1148103.1 hypothetical protein [Bacteroidales bacterium]MCM1206519.1 hypothetical protein [Bacillota bacterium]MCM1510579.1 hypothetical protein [Clostridium sp.]
MYLSPKITTFAQHNRQKAPDTGNPWRADTYKSNYNISNYGKILQNFPGIHPEPRRSLRGGHHNVTVNVDDPERVKISVNYEEKTVTAGANELDVAAYTQIAVEAKAGAMLKSVVRTSDGGTEYISGMTSCSIYVTDYNSGETWTVTSADEKDIRTASCKVTVDEAAKVRVQRSGTYTGVTLADGENTVLFAPGTETQLMIASANYSTPLYKVTLDGEPLESQYGTWYVTLSQDAEISILANYPDIPVPVRFVYEDEESKGFITGVTVNGETAENYNDEDFTVKAGSVLAISGNTTDYKLDNFSVNGTAPQYFYSPYSVTVTDETEIYVKAHKYATISATLDIDNPENVTVCRGYSYENNKIENLVSGKNTLELSETNSMISIKAEAGCYITSVTDNNGTTYAQDYSGSYNVTLTDGMTVTVISGKIVRDRHAVVYIDDRSAASTYFSFARADRSEIDMTTGYNTVEFSSSDNPMNISWYGAPYANVYLNDNVLNPLYENSTTYQTELADGDVLKLFLASNPKRHDVTFDAQEGIGAEVVRDLVTTVTDWKNGFKTLHGTQVDITADTEDITVTVNNEPLAAAGGKYTFTVSTDTNVVISKATGISNTDARTAENGTVYNMQGMKMQDKAGLPAGMYIVNGKKTVVR